MWRGEGGLGAKVEPEEDEGGGGEKVGRGEVGWSAAGGEARRAQNLGILCARDGVSDPAFYSDRLQGAPKQSPRKADERERGRT